MFLEELFNHLEHVAQVDQAAPWKSKNPQAILTTLVQSLGTHKPETKVKMVTG